MARAVFLNETIGQYNGSYDPKYTITHSGGTLTACALTLANPVLSNGTPLNADTMNNLFDFDNMDSMKGNRRRTVFSAGGVTEEITAKGSSVVNARRETTFTSGGTREVTTVYNDAGTAALRTTTATTTFGGGEIIEEVE